MRPTAVIIGSGALGLGFLAERMAADYELCLVDTGAKTEMLERIRADQGYTVNICDPKGIAPREVTGSFDTIVADTPEGHQRLNLALQGSDLVLTATGRRLLDAVVPSIAPAMNARTRRAWLLFCENGLHIASSYAGDFAPPITLADTVMSRMCRFANVRDENVFRPLWPGAATALVAEDYSFLPLDAQVCATGPFSPVFSMISHEEFLCWENVKLYLHNGMHAFVSCHAFIEGVERFPDTPQSIRQRARE